MSHSNRRRNSVSMITRCKLQLHGSEHWDTGKHPKDRHPAGSGHPAGSVRPCGSRLLCVFWWEHRTAHASGEEMVKSYPDNLPAFTLRPAIPLGLHAQEKLSEPECTRLCVVAFLVAETADGGPAEESLITSTQQSRRQLWERNEEHQHASPPVTRELQFPCERTSTWNPEASIRGSSAVLPGRAHAQSGRRSELPDGHVSS